MRNSFVAIAMLAIVIGVPPAASEELSVGFSDQTYDIGHGFNPVTGQFYRPCIKSPAIAKDVSGNKTESYQIKRITSSSEIRESLNLNAYASTFGGAYKVSSSVEKLLTSGLKSRSSYFSIRVRVTGDNKTIAEDIAISDNGMKALKLSDDFFKKYCGDSFVPSTRGGGELFALISLENISEDQAKTFEASLNASYLNSDAKAKYKEQWEKLREESQLTVEIMQSGVIGEPFKSLTDIEAMLEYARQFPNKIRASGGANIQSVIYQKYTNSVAFGIALDSANRERFTDFDDSSRIMKELISLYDLANTRVELASDALSRPDEFDEVDKEKVEAFLKAIVSTRDRLAGLARSCAASSKEGKSCAPTKDTDLIVPAAGSLKRSTPCNLTTFAVSNGSAAATCSQVRKINGRCLCVECQLFVSPPYAVQDSQSLSDRCFKMPNGATISLSAKFNVRVNSNPEDHWLMIGVNNHTNLIDQGNLRGSQTPIQRQLEYKVGDDGNFTAELRMTKCQSNRVTKDTCTISAADGRVGPLMTVRIKD